VQNSSLGQLSAPCLGTSIAIIPTRTPVPDAALDGRYVISMNGGKLDATPIPDNAVVVDPHSYPSVYGLLRCYVHPALLASVLEALPASMLESVLADLRQVH
jgi:hypothetical protein